MNKEEMSKIIEDFKYAEEFFDKDFWPVFQSEYSFPNDVRGICKRGYIDTDIGRLNMIMEYQRIIKK